MFACFTAGFSEQLLRMMSCPCSLLCGPDQGRLLVHSCSTYRNAIGSNTDHLRPFPSAGLIFSSRVSFNLGANHLDSTSTPITRFRRRRQFCGRNLGATIYRPQSRRQYRFQPGRQSVVALAVNTSRFLNQTVTLLLTSGRLVSPRIMMSI